MTIPPDEDRPMPAQGGLVVPLDGQPVDDDDEARIPASADAAGEMLDNSRLYEELRRRQRWLDASGEITVHLLEGSDPAEVLRLIAHRALELTGADYTLIAVPNPAAPADALELTVAVCIGMGADTITGRTIPLSGSTSGAVYADQLPRNVDTLAMDLADGLGIDFGPALALPLQAGGMVAGVLLTLRTAGAAPFDEAQLRVVASFADQAALVLRHAENETARRRLEVVADRDRIARDLHDHVIQRLFAIGLSLQSTRRRSQQLPEVNKRLGEHIDQLQDIIHEVRSAIFDLHDDDTDEPSLAAVVRSIVAELTADTQMQTTIHLPGTFTGIPPAVRHHAEAVVREAVSNVVRHAAARRLTVTVSVDANLTINVVDDGSGIPDSVARSGLQNLAERATECGGIFRVHAPVEGGTDLLWSVPVNAPS
jgi:signal transduction histidine kinase